jgi:Uma2 family endonuclease
MATTATMTGAQFDALPYEEGRRWELVNGELIAVPSPTWRHQDIAFEMHLALKQYFRTSGAKGLVAQDVEFAMTADDRVRPDVCVLLNEKADRLDLDKIPIPGAPDLAVEIISPSERTNESYGKVVRYLQCGTTEVWQVYPKLRTVHIYRRDKTYVVGPGESITSDLLPGLNYTLQIE